jgi:NhaA family Na+:H+ antiporter
MAASTERRPLRSSGAVRRKRRIALALPLVIQPMQEFLQLEAAGGILLLVATVAALIWANGPFGNSYLDFWGAHLGVDINLLAINMPLGTWVNDGLMAIFFFVAGMEIKREILQGELADRRKAVLPIVAALGGMIVPALIFLTFNAGRQGEHGWGIPMATDIAFAVGVLSLLGSRVPLSLKVFLLALAIADDLGAIVVIALFYSQGIAFTWLAAACGCFALTALLGVMGVRPVIVYVAVGVVAWVAMYESGIHATIAGVILGLLTPLHPHFRERELERNALDLVVEFRSAEHEGTREGHERGRSALRALENLSRESRSPLDRLEHALHPWTSYAIVPVFALANAGVVLDSHAISNAAHSPITAGVAIGLMLGKPTGILLFSWLAVRFGLASLPGDASWDELAGVALVAGVGFTVSLFVSGLAFPGSVLVEDAKMGILAGSTSMAVIGYAGLQLISRRSPARAIVPDSPPTSASGA